MKSRNAVLSTKVLIEQHKETYLFIRIPIYTWTPEVPLYNLVYKKYQQLVPTKEKSILARVPDSMTGDVPLFHGLDHCAWV